jgi:hypothetical protein
MFKARTLKVLASILLIYGLLWLPAAFVPSYADSQVGSWLAAPLLSVYLFHLIGVPGLLEHDGLCGSGWCSPTTFGWIFTVTALLLVAWIVAWTIASSVTRMVSR